MKPTNDLFQLIKSLSRGEKRFFTVEMDRYEKEKKSNSLRLFEVIDKMKTYDEKKIKTKYEHEPFMKHFAIEKAFLYQKILNCLSIYHANHNVDAELFRLLHQIDILYRKALFKQFAALVAKAKKLAYKYEKWIMLLRLFRWERELVLLKPLADKYELSNEKIDVEEKKVLGHLITFSEYNELFKKMYNYHYNRGNVRTEKELHKFKEGFLPPKSDLIKHSLSIENKDFLYHIYSVYHHSVGDFKIRNEYNLKRVELFEANPHLIKEKRDVYAVVLHNLVLMNEGYKNEELTFSTIKKLKDLLNLETERLNDIRFELRIFRITATVELLFYTSTGQFKKGYVMRKEVEDNINSFAPHFDGRFKTPLYFHLAYVCFGVGDYKNTLYYLNKLLELSPSFDFQVYSAGKIMHLLTYFEMNKQDLLEYTIVSTYRFLKKQEKLCGFERLVVSILRNAKTFSKRQQAIDFLGKCKDQLLKLKQDEFERHPFAYFDYVSWVESKLQNKGFAVVVQHNFEKEKAVSQK